MCCSWPTFGPAGTSCGINMTDKPAEILIVDDEVDIRHLIQGILEDEGYICSSVASAEEAYAAIAEKAPDLIVQDIWLQGGEDDGLAILKNVKDQHPTLPFVMISGHGTIETAVSAIKDGAYDFIEKPFKSDRLIMMIKRALEAAALKRENEVLKKQSPQPVSLIGSSGYVERLKQLIARIAATNSRVLIKGEQGTGKDIVARLIHSSSPRASAPYFVLNCASLHPERLELELFGQEASAGREAHTGILEQADGGTLLLDEIADMPLETQAKIVRVTQEQRFQRLGGQSFVEVDVRILASSHKDLEKLMNEDLFRQDLYYRLNVVPVELLPLRERLGDLEAFCAAFFENLAPQGAEGSFTFSAKALEMMREYKWPGNIRQLRNVVEWVLIMHGDQDTRKFGPEHLPPEFTGSVSSEHGEKANSTKAPDFLDLTLRDARETF